MISSIYLWSEALNSINYLCAQIFKFLGSGCGTVNRVVASNVSDPRLGTSHRETLLEQLSCARWLYWKDKKRKKRHKVSIAKDSTDAYTFKPEILHSSLINCCSFNDITKAGLTSVRKADLTSNDWEKIKRSSNFGQVVSVPASAVTSQPTAQIL